MDSGVRLMVGGAWHVRRKAGTPPQPPWPSFPSPVPPVGNLSPGRPSGDLGCSQDHNIELRSARKTVLLVFHHRVVGPWLQTHRRSLLGTPTSPY